MAPADAEQDSGHHKVDARRHDGEEQTQIELLQLVAVNQMVDGRPGDDDPCHEDEAAIALVGILGYLIVSFSDNMQYYLSFNWYFWFFCGLILASMGMETQSPPETEQAAA